MRKKVLFVISSILFSVLVHADIDMKSGRWLIVTKSTLNNVDMEKQEKKRMEEAPAKIPADKGAEYDRAMAAEKAELNSGQHYECLQAPKIVTSKEMMEKTKRSLQDEPWICKYTDERADDRGYSFKASCSTTAGARSETVVQYIAFSNTSYRFTSTGNGQGINGAGKPLGGMMTIHSVMDGKWISAQCQPQDELDDDDAADDQ